VAAGNREAQVQSFADAYLAIAVRFALTVVMVPLMRKVAALKDRCKCGSVTRGLADLFRAFPRIDLYWIRPAQVFRASVMTHGASLNKIGPHVRSD
jgi:hypothetical protein